MKLVLVDIEEQMCTAWRQAFQNLPSVDIVQGRFETVADFDCIVSAANSFGIMDGGIDAAIVRFFGGELMEHIQTVILRDYMGEQLVGTSLIVETGNRQHPFVAHTPTMRVPMPIAHTDNVYRAMWAMLLAVRQHNAANRRKKSVINFV